MAISLQIDQLIENLLALKKSAGSDPNIDSEKFNKILQESIESSNNSNLESSEFEAKNPGETKFPDNSNGVEIISDSESSNKPSMRTLIEALSGKTVEELYADPQSNWIDVSNQASEILYGVVGDGVDSRNWSKIMSSSNILEAVREETKNMVSPTVELASIKRNEEQSTTQYMALKDSKGTTLRSLVGPEDLIYKILNNYGMSSIKLEDDLQNKIIDENFDRDVLTSLRDFSN